MWRGKINPMTVQEGQEARRSARCKPVEKWKANRMIPFDGGKPNCFEWGEWAKWTKRAKNSPPGPLGPCMDCSAVWQMAMVKAGKCERPMVRFRRDLDGALEAYIPKVSE